MAKAGIKKKKPSSALLRGGQRMSAGEFKAKCLGAMTEVAKTGRPLLVTKRGEPLVEVTPVRNMRNDKKKHWFLGRLEGIVEIVGDPDDLIKPVFPLEDYDMLK